VQRPEQGPGAAAWLIALVSFVLPWIAAAFAVMGVWQIRHDDRQGWWLVGLAAVLFVADLLIDLVWAHPSVSRSDLPDLNCRAAQLIGRSFVVEEVIEGGRGKVRVGDTLWAVEGPDLPAGAEVRVTAVNATLLRVEQV
jgi:membrane protein implicated in regulation of membrane protease activity